jgi:glutamate/tyrosine decarboxylase-like PLP-dependent enzyme
MDTESQTTQAEGSSVDVELLGDVLRRSVSYLRDVGSRRVAPLASSIAALEAIDGELPDVPTAPQDVLELLDRIGSPATVATAGGRYYGFVNGGTLPASLAASWLVSAWDQNAALRVMSPAAAAFEDAAIEWVRDLLNLPAGGGGAVVTGATMANFSALAAARHALLERAGWDVENEGLFDAPPLTVVVGDEVHVSVLKALGLLGLGRQRVHKVPVDSQGRIRAEAVPALDERTIVCIQAGNVNTGAFDPAGEICRRARDAGAWVHVDGAFGIWAAASPRYRHLTEGFSAADSWATDGHKWPNVGYDCGFAFVRDLRALRSAMAMSSAYFVPGERREASQFSPESSRRARGVELWATLRSLGRQGLADLIERTCGHAQQFADGLRESGYQILNEVVINQVLVSFGTPALTRSVIEALQEEGTCWCGGTEWQGHVAMRISVSSWATTRHDVEQSLGAIRRVAAACALRDSKTIESSR